MDEWEDLRDRLFGSNKKVTSPRIYTEIQRENGSYKLNVKSELEFAFPTTRWGDMNDYDFMVKTRWGIKVDTGKIIEYDLGRGGQILFRLNFVKSHLSRYNEGRKIA